MHALLSVKRKTVNIEIRGEKLTLREIGLSEFEAITSRDGIKGSELTARMLVACAIDADGKPVFTEEEVKAIQELPAGVLLEVGNALAEVNGFADAEKN